MKILGLILAWERGKDLVNLTKVRASSALPVFGKYRVIDFALTNMVNAGISKIGIITQYNPRSLMDHLGSGKEWDLDRKTGGLFILQPYFSLENRNMGYAGTADSVFQNMTLFRRGNEDHVLIGSGDHVFRIDYNELFRNHLETGADMTIMTTVVEESDLAEGDWTVDTTSSGRVTGWKEYRPDKTVADSGKSTRTIPLGVYFINKYLLKELLYANVPEGKNDLIRDIFIPCSSSISVHEHRFRGYWRDLQTGINLYYKTNMEALQDEVRAELFYKHGTVYTKLKDLPPPKIANTAQIKNSIIADGSIISGKVENSVLFRNTRVFAGAVVKNSVVLESTVIEEGAVVENAVLDKNAIVRSGRTLQGKPSKPASIEKHGVV